MTEQGDGETPRRRTGGAFDLHTLGDDQALAATGVSAAIKLAFTLAKSGFQDRLAARVAQAAAAAPGAEAAS